MQNSIVKMDLRELENTADREDSDTSSNRKVSKGQS